MGRSRNVAELMTLARALPGRGPMLCAVCAVAVPLDRDYIRAREAGTPMPTIGRTVTINTEKTAGSHPSAASRYRALAEAAPIVYVALCDGSG